jgi:hypothetical protein
MVGDDDEVTLEHAVEMYRPLPNAELAIVPGTSHGLLVEKPDLCNGLIIDFPDHRTGADLGADTSRKHVTMLIVSGSRRLPSARCVVRGQAPR